MGVGKRIREARIALGMTQRELAGRIGVSPGAVGNYEAETNHPKEPVMYALLNVLGVDANYLFQDAMKAAQEDGNRRFDVSFDERMHIEKYRRLDDRGRESVGLLLEQERLRVISAKEDDEPAGDCSALTWMDIYTCPAVAGILAFAGPGGKFERLAFPEAEIPKGADFGVRVSGDSMEPTIPDGAIAWVKQSYALSSGQIGIFMVDGEPICKRYYLYGDETCLESDNSDYGPIRVRGGERNFGIVGRVLGCR